jgi:hypothetical protein
VQRLYDEADLNRAIQAYRFFYPTVSGAAVYEGSLEAGAVENEVFPVLDTRPHHVGFTPSSDAPYASILLDLRAGPFVIELPAGPLLGVAVDLNQRWIADLGVPGPDKGQGGKHLILPPGYREPTPDGYHVEKSTTNRVIVTVRSLPIDGDMKGAVERLQTLTVRPLNPPADWEKPRWLDMTDKPHDTTPLKWENNLKYWQELHWVVDTEPPLDDYRNYYGELAALGIAKGKPFAPDARMRRILEAAARAGLGQMRAQSFADRRPDRVVWMDRKWEWPALRHGDSLFNAAVYVDLAAREVWFYQAVGASPATFRRGAGASSVHWLGLRDLSGRYLDGGKSYRLSVPLPVPGKLSWSVTVYDAETRSQIATDQGRAALRSQFELKDVTGTTAELSFGPRAPAGQEGRWIKTIPGKSWFAYFRVYAPEKGAFDGSWKPGDFDEVR